MHYNGTETEINMKISMYLRFYWFCVHLVAIFLLTLLLLVLLIVICPSNPGH